MNAHRVMGICGSLRQGSYNGALLRAARAFAPVRMDIQIFEIGDVPLYNGDEERRGDPKPVQHLKTAMREADGFLFATPEYQHGMPGVLKNVLDWASRPAGQSAMRGKAAAVIGASPGATGTARAQEQLRATLTFNEVYVVPGPEVLVARVHEKVDASGAFVDPTAEPYVRLLLANLARLIDALDMVATPSAVI